MDNGDMNDWMIGSHEFTKKKKKQTPSSPFVALSTGLVTHRARGS